MTVKELIAELEKFPEDIEVVWHSPENDPHIEYSEDIEANEYLKVFLC